jgi:probable rRNA maturation factor
MAASTGRRGSRLRVVVTDGRGRPVAAAGLAGWLARAAPASARGDVTIALISDRAMRRLNADYRGVDRLTDVLSFDLGPGAARPRRVAGDVAIALGLAGRQAARLGHPLAKELRILALHGLLHLLGYDHETDQGQMYRLEERLRRRHRLPGGLIGRSVRRPDSR